MSSQPPHSPAVQEVWQDIARHRDRLMALVRTRLPTRQDAEDCVQEAMIRTASHRDLDPARLGPFLTTVALRLCVDFHRARNRQQALVLRAHPADPPAAPEDDVCDAAFGRWLLERTHTLSPRQRDVLLARAAGLPVTAFAARHGISVKSAEAAFTRGRARLRELARTELAAAGDSPAPGAETGHHSTWTRPNQ